LHGNEAAWWANLQIAPSCKAALAKKPDSMARRPNALLPLARTKAFKAHHRVTEHERSIWFDNQSERYQQPPLLEGEDKERYLRLRAAVVGELKPISVFDWINAKDQVDKLWEEERYRRAAAAAYQWRVAQGLGLLPQ
jgi:hypothetical protein